VNIRPEVVNDIQLLYKGTPVQNASFLQIRIKNIGNQPITENDYNRPIIFSINPNFKLLDVSVAGSNPSNLGILPEQTSDNQVEINKVLLNPNDEVTIKLTTVGDPKESVLSGFIVDGRIVGIRELDIITPDKKASITDTMRLIVPGIELLAISLVGLTLSMLFRIIIPKVRQPRRPPNVIVHGNVPAFSDNYMELVDHGNITNYVFLPIPVSTAVIKCKVNIEPGVIIIKRRDASGFGLRPFNLSHGGTR
jgi:hypothetical protein